ncbi:MAG: hypothetical protein ACOC56_01990, partial [Atribacterota bacterium]
TVENGIFHSTITPTGVNWNEIEPYIEVNVGKKGELLEALEPREKIISSVYALNADKLDGKDSKFLVPSGGIIMWSGAPGDIPEGWALCDGTNDTPDLSGKFIVGYNSGDTDYDTVGNTGGEKMHILIESEIPAHTHDWSDTSSSSLGSHTHNVNDPGHKHSITDKPCSYSGEKTGNESNINVHIGDYYTNNATTGISLDSVNLSHTHDVSGTTDSGTGSGQAHENRPPYYVLCFIMKL